MALFPFFRDIEGAVGLIIGTGKHAQEKQEKLKPYGPKLLVIEEADRSTDSGKHRRNFGFFTGKTPGDFPGV